MLSPTTVKKLAQLRSLLIEACLRKQADPNQEFHPKSSDGTISLEFPDAFYSASGSIPDYVEPTVIVWSYALGSSSKNAFTTVDDAIAEVKTWRHR